MVYFIVCSTLYLVAILVLLVSILMNGIKKMALFQINFELNVYYSLKIYNYKFKNKNKNIIDLKFSTPYEYKLNKEYYFFNLFNNYYPISSGFILTMLIFPLYSYLLFLNNFQIDLQFIENNEPFFKYFTLIAVFVLFFLSILNHYVIYQRVKELESITFCEVIGKKTGHDESNNHVFKIKYFAKGEEITTYVQGDIDWLKKDSEKLKICYDPKYPHFSKVLPS